MSEYRTKDCIAVLDKWLSQHMGQPNAWLSPSQTHSVLGLGQWKRLKKSKNSQGLWVRIFENKVTDLIVDVVESPMGLVVLEPKTTQTNLVATTSKSKIYLAKIAYDSGGIYDAEGEKLKNGSAEATVKYYMGVDNLEAICVGLDETDDDGTPVKIYSFTDDDTGRDYCLMLYTDGSWLIESD